MGRRVLKFDGPSGRGLWYRYGATLWPGFKGFRRFIGFKGWRYRPAGDEFYNAAFGGHVHIKYHNQDYHHPSLRHFVALFP